MVILIFYLLGKKHFQHVYHFKMISKSWRAFSFYTSISSKMFLQVWTKLLLHTVTLRLYIECTPVDYVVVYYRLTDWHSSIRWAAAHLLSYASHQVPYFCLCSCIQRFVVYNNTYTKKHCSVLSGFDIKRNYNILLRTTTVCFLSFSRFFFLFGLVPSKSFHEE